MTKLSRTDTDLPLWRRHNDDKVDGDENFDVAFCPRDAPIHDVGPRVTQLDADRARPLRLFDLDDGPTGPSNPETPPPSSQSRTPDQPSRPKMRAPVAKADDVPVAGNLAQLNHAAIAAADANRILDDAIAAARRAGHSWRAIAAHTGIPFQTLHQRARRPNHQRQPSQTNGG